MERDIICDLSVTEQKEIEEIDIALGKLDDGTYGICDDCKEEIPIARLKVKPYAEYCTKCRKMEERNEKHPFPVTENE